jgi:FKBP12-rapamycin complex-associated protein
MSMVVYILGLGDRHPSNLMLDRLSGKILHIDFGDCFEVAMTREKFPEKIPFRLTRMLVNAMEVSHPTCHFVTYSSNLSVCGVAGDRN